MGWALNKIRLNQLGEIDAVQGLTVEVEPTLFPNTAGVGAQVIADDTYS